jgi:hypothetical protein
MAATRLSPLQQRILRWVAVDAQRTRGVVASRHQELVRALTGDKGTISHRLRTLEAQGGLVIDRSAGGKAESLRLTPEGQKGACPCAGRCDSEEELIETMGYGRCKPPRRVRSPLPAGSLAKLLRNS